LLTLITPTRDRSRCFGLLESYIARQDYRGEYVWIVVNDGAEEYTYNLGQVVIRRDPSSDTLPSICHNYLAALPHVQGDKVLAIEDDDFYGPNFLSVMCEALDRADLVGSVPAKYYNLISHRWQVMRNTQHASLAQTGFTKAVLPMFEFLAGMGDVYIDMLLWAHAQTEKVKTLLIENNGLHIGMKGLWGTAGIGLGHNPASGTLDNGLRKLQEWLGPDWENYK
jgi:hypothetical protein